jgi:hypothetical protein
LYRYVGNSATNFKDPMGLTGQGEADKVGASSKHLRGWRGYLIPRSSRPVAPQLGGFDPDTGCDGLVSLTGCSSCHNSSTLWDGMPRYVDPDGTMTPIDGSDSAPLRGMGEAETIMAVGLATVPLVGLLPEVLFGGAAVGEVVAAEEIIITETEVEIDIIAITRGPLGPLPPPTPPWYPPVFPN